MSEKQKLARQRNHAKMRLSGIALPFEGLTRKERELVKDLQWYIDGVTKKLFEKWDDNSRELGLKPLPKHKLKYSDEWWQKKIKEEQELIDNKKNKTTMGLFNGKFKWLTGEIEYPADIDDQETEKRSNLFKDAMDRDLGANTFVDTDNAKLESDNAGGFLKIGRFFSFTNTDGQDEKH